MQDNDPKHVSKLAQQYYIDNNINWWRTPPESSDLNLILAKGGQTKKPVATHQWNCAVLEYSRCEKMLQIY